MVVSQPAEWFVIVLHSAFCDVRPVIKLTGLFSGAVIGLSALVAGAGVFIFAVIVYAIYVRCR